MISGTCKKRTDAVGREARSLAQTCVCVVNSLPPCCRSLQSYCLSRCARGDFLLLCGVKGYVARMLQIMIELYGTLSIFCNPKATDNWLDLSKALNFSKGLVLAKCSTAGHDVTTISVVVTDSRLGTGNEVACQWRYVLVDTSLERCYFLGPQQGMR